MIRKIITGGAAAAIVASLALWQPAPAQTLMGNCIGTVGIVTQPTGVGSVYCTPVVPPPPLQTVALTATPTSINAGQSSTLTWSSTNATSCSASGSWNGVQPVNGSLMVSPLVSSTYTLTCNGGSGSVSASANVAVTAPPPPASCNLSAPAFCETFNQGPSAIRGRGGDLNPAKWATARLSGEFLSYGQGALNPVTIAPAPSCRAGITQPAVYPPNDTLICDPSGGKTQQLMTAVAMQNYGVNSYMVRQPFDFAGRTGKIDFDTDASVNQQLGGYVEIEITDTPVPATTFREFQNFEVGPIPQNGLSIKFLSPGNCGATPVNTMVYVNYVGTIITPMFDHANGCAAVSAGSLNHFEIQVSQTHVDVYGSDFSTDNGKTFPNFKLLYSATINLPFTQGYIHFNGKNHATVKYGFGPDAVFYWDNLGFDGPMIPAPRAYEIPDNITMATYNGSPVQNLGYLLLDGTTGKPAGVYDPVNKINLAFQNVDTSGMSTATLTLNALFQALTHTANTSWGINYRFNGGTWRTYNLTTGDLASINAIAGAPLGILSMLINVPITDLIQGTNSLELLPVNAPMDYPPIVTNIDLLLGAAPPPPSSLGMNCGLVLGGAVTFCEPFDVVNSGTPSRSGALDPNVWGVSRATGNTNFGVGQYNGWAASTQLQTCNGVTTVGPPNDVIICNGRLREATNDNPTGVFETGGVTTLAMYPKQPFDFAGRIGTVSFDVSNDTHSIHAAWPEFWMSNLPVPAPFNHFDSWQALPQHGFGVRFAAQAAPGSGGLCPNPNNLNQPRWTVDSAVVVRNYVMEDRNPGVGATTTFGTVSNPPLTVNILDCVIAPPDGSGIMNHVEIRVSQSMIDVYATDAGVVASQTTLRKIASITNANLTFTRGLIWLEDVHYNADKGGSPSQRQHTFVWDNVAFDGPFTYRDFSYDALDVGQVDAMTSTMDLGKFSLPNQTASWNVLNVPANPQAAVVRVLFNFTNVFSPIPTMLNVIINGHAHATPWPYPDTLQNTWRTFAVVVPVTDLVPGTNVVQIGSDQPTITSNVNIVLVDVPGGVPVLPGNSRIYPN